MVAGVLEVAVALKVAGEVVLVAAGVDDMVAANMLDVAVILKVVAEVVVINIRETHQLLHLQLNLILHRRTNSNLNFNKLVELSINKSNQNRLTKQISYHNNQPSNKIVQEIIPRCFKARDKFKVRSHYQKSSPQIQQLIILLL